MPRPVLILGGGAAGLLASGGAAIAGGGVTTGGASTSGKSVALSVMEVVLPLSGVGSLMFNYQKTQVGKCASSRARQRAAHHRWLRGRAGYGGNLVVRQRTECGR